MLTAAKTTPLIKTVLHPSDFSDVSLLAFAHALKTALITGSKLSFIHVAKDEPERAEFPGVREILERWKVLPPNSPRSAVAELGIDVAKIVGCGPSPAEVILEYLKRHTADLIVLATHHRGGDWLHQSVAEPVARKSGEMTLFVPAGARGFVSLEDGSVLLRTILIPVAAKPSPEAAIAGAVRIVEQLKCGPGTFRILHIGKEGSIPVGATPEVPGWTWEKVTGEGEVIAGILEDARQVDADLIVMTTDGRNGFLDALRGSHSERVVRQSPCPVLAIPETSYGASMLT